MSERPPERPIERGMHDPYPALHEGHDEATGAEHHEYREYEEVPSADRDTGVSADGVADERLRRKEETRQERNSPGFTTEPGKGPKPPSRPRR